MEKTNEFNPDAVEWVDRVNSASGTAAGWRLEVLTKRFRKKYKDDDKKIPIRIRRFVRGLPWALVHDAAKYLMSLAPYEGVIYNGVKIEGKYRPTVTRWVRDDQERVDGQASGSYTLIQDLIEDDVTDEFSATSGGSCSEEVLTEWRWDDPDITDISALPDFGAQGVSYSIQAVHRNEDGTYGYAVIKRVAKTQFSGWHTVECDEFETTETATWDNVYGGIGGDPYDVGGFEEIPTACDAPDGELVVVQVSENQDCTYKVVVQRKTANNVPNASITQSSTVFESVSKHAHRAQDAALAGPPSPRNGVTYTHETTKRPDGKFETSVQEMKEKYVSNARVERRKTLRGTIEVTSSRNSSNGSCTVRKIGDEVTVEQTPGGLWNRTVKTIDTTPVGKVAAQCSKNLFEHRHSETQNTNSNNTPHVAEAKSGETREVSSRLTEEGTWDITTTTTTEQQVSSARVEKRKTLRGVVTTTTERNTTASDTSVNNIGDAVVVEKTPGGLYNRTVTTVLSKSVGDLAQDCRKTVFEHRHSTTKNSGSLPTPDVSDAGSGVIHERSSRRTEEGTWDTTDVKVTELNVPKASQTTRKTLRSTITTVVEKNSDNGTIPQIGIGGEVQLVKTPGGRWDRTITTSKVDPVGEIARGSGSTVFETTSSTTSNSDAPNSGSGTAGGGQRTEISSRRNEDGSWDNTMQTTQEKGVSSAEKSVKKTIHGTITTTVDRNSANSSTSVSDFGESKSARMTPGGHYDRTETQQKAGDYKTWDIKASLNHLYTERVWFINATQTQYKSLMSNKESEWKGKLKQWVNQKRPFSSASVSPEVSYTEWDRYDGSITFTVRWAANSAGQDDSIDEIFLDQYSHVSSVGGIKTFFNRTVMGRGLDELNKTIASGPRANSLGCTDSCSYSPETGCWSFSRKETVGNAS